MQSTFAIAPTQWCVVCLCAEWCGVCREWRAAFEQAAAAHPDVRFTWIDVEDEAQAMGDFDIETFPTVLIARGAHPRFLGPVQPSAAQLVRLLASLQERADVPASMPEAAALWRRIAPLLLLNP